MPETDDPNVNIVAQYSFLQISNLAYTFLPNALSFYIISLHLKYCKLKDNVRIFTAEEKGATVLHVLAKKCFGETLNTCSLPWALEVTSGTDTGKRIGFMTFSNTDRGLNPSPVTFI